MANKQKYPVTIIQGMISQSGDKKYLQLATDLIVPGYTKKNGETVEAVKLEKYSFVEIQDKPDEETIANAKSEGQKSYLVRTLENWGFGLKDEKKELLAREYRVKPRTERQ